MIMYECYIPQAKNLRAELSLVQDFMILICRYPRSMMS